MKEWITILIDFYVYQKRGRTEKMNRRKGGDLIKNVLVLTKVSTVCPSMLKIVTLVIDTHRPGRNAVLQTLKKQL